MVFSFDTYRKASNDITCQAVYDWAEPGSTPTVTTLIREFLRRVQVLPWDEGVAQTYVDLRAACTLNGTTLSALDMMIAAHAVNAKITLVTHDEAFSRVPNQLLRVEDWVQS